LAVWSAHHHYCWVSYLALSIYLASSGCLFILY